jgi:anti-sigma factor RsiW
MTHTEAVRSAAAERYLLDELSEPERFAFEEHYFECSECAEGVRMGALMRDGVRAGLLPDARVTSISEASGRKSSRPAVGWRPSALVPWAAAAALALVAGYQAVQPARSGARLVGPQALAPVTLRPESRGVVPVVPVQPGATAITLAIEVNAPAGAALAYDIRTEDEKSVVSGQVAAPPAGAPLLLLIPVWTLSPSEHYILSVRRAADGQILDEYRFEVAGR